MKKCWKLSIWVTLAFTLACGQEVKMVEVDPTSTSFTKKSQSTKIEVQAKDIRDAPMEGVTFTFTSENTSVATVDSGGVVKPVGDGSTYVVARSPNGVEGGVHVKVCLPKELICDPGDKLKLKVGTAGPIKCHVTDCKEETIRGARIELTPKSREMVLKEGDNIFIGLKVGDTEIDIKAGELEKTVSVRIDEQVYLPGMGPGSGGGGGRRGGGKKDDDPYAGGGGRFDHILKNMKFKE